MSLSALKHHSIHDQTVTSSFFLQEEILVSVKYIYLHNKNQFLKPSLYSNRVPHKVIMSQVVKKAFRSFIHAMSVAC